MAAAADAQAEIDALRERKNAVEASLAALEKQLYALETTFLDESFRPGGLMRLGEPRGNNYAAKRKWREADRLFSLSSATAIDTSEQDPSASTGPSLGLRSRYDRMRPQSPFDTNRMRRSTGRMRRAGDEMDLDD